MSNGVSMSILYSIVGGVIPAMGFGVIWLILAWRGKLHQYSFNANSFDIGGTAARVLLAWLFYLIGSFVVPLVLYRRNGWSVNEFFGVWIAAGMFSYPLLVITVLILRRIKILQRHHNKNVREH